MRENYGLCTVFRRTLLRTLRSPYVMAIPSVAWDVRVHYSWGLISEAEQSKISWRTLDHQSCPISATCAVWQRLPCSIGVTICVTAVCTCLVHIGEAAVGAASTLSTMSTMQGTSFQFGILTLDRSLPGFVTWWLNWTLLENSSNGTKERWKQDTIIK